MMLWAAAWLCGSVHAQAQAPPATGVDYFSAPSPNPARVEAHFFLSLPRNLGAAALLVMDFLGQQVAEVPLAAGQQELLLDVRNLRPGIYFVRLVVGGRPLQTRRLVISQ